MQGPRLRSHSQSEPSSESIQNFLLLAPRKSLTNNNNNNNNNESNENPLNDNTQEEEKRENNGNSENGGNGGDEPPIGLGRGRLFNLRRIVLKQLSFLGPGMIAAVAYVDPGNWATDLLSGSQFGYAQLFVVLSAGLMALLFQILSTRLGTVTGLDLAQHCRLALHDRPKHKMLYRWGLLYPLYVISEAAIILTDLAEMLGSAIAINLIFPVIPLPACVVLTAFDVILILLLFDQYPTKFVTRRMRMFEFMIFILIAIVLGSFIALLVKVQPDWSMAFNGYIPSAGIVQNGGLYAAVGIIGSTIMPHALYLGSKIATMRRVVPSDYEKLSSTTDLSSSDVKRNLDYDPSDTSAPKPTLECVRAHLPYAQFDIAFSLIAFAVAINSAILIVSAAVFFYGSDAVVAEVAGDGVSSLFDAYALVGEVVGVAFGYLFAIGLFAAGQAAALTVTLSGQIISEGFIRWKTVPWKRRLITRAIGIIPSLTVATVVGKNGIDTLLVGSQVGLSIVLPFVLAPLIIFTSSHHLMSIPINPTTQPLPYSTPSPLPFPSPTTSIPPTLDLELATPSTPSPPPPPPPYLFPSIPSISLKSSGLILKTLNPFRKRGSPSGMVSFVSAVWVIWLAVVCFWAINAANFYAIVQLGLGTA